MEKQNCCGRPLPACSEFFGDQKGEKGEPETFAALKAPRQRRRQGEGQNGWLVPGEKRGVAEERGIRRKDVFEGCTEGCTVSSELGCECWVTLEGMEHFPTSGSGVRLRT